ncbi:hypothetical protein DYH09_29980 [bacterium CPR1]|nr:hypothetical protein [bacterium CPR1]
MFKKARLRLLLRGVGLANTLVVITIMVTLAFTVASVSFSHLSVSNRLSNAEVARNRAESVVAMAIDRVITDREASNPDFAGTVTLPVPASEPPGSGVACFDELQAQAQQIPHSTNNITADVSKIGALGRVVPAHGIHVIGVGRCNGVERRVEAVLLIPKFPFSIASSGRITSNGGLKVVSLDDLSLLASGGLASIPPDQLNPGDIASNSNDASQAMNLQGTGIHITGDARAVGGIDYDTGTVVVDGSVLPNSDKTYLPKLNLSDYDPASKPGLVTVSGNQSNLEVDNWTRSSGDLFVSGGLKLDSGVLYVDGNLSVNGGISGKGAVIVTGSIEVFGGGVQASDNVAAILAGQGLKLQANQADQAQIKGLIYTEGDLSADWVTLGGATVANASGAGSQVTLNNTDIAYNESATDFSITVGGGSVSAFPPSPGPWNGPASAISNTYRPTNHLSPSCPDLVPFSFKPVLSTAPPPSFFYQPGPPPSYAVPDAATLAGQVQWQVQVGSQPATTVSYTDLLSTLRNQMSSELGAEYSAGDDTNIDRTFFTGYPAPAPPGPKYIETYVQNSLVSDYEASLPLIEMNDYLADNSPASDWGSGSTPQIGEEFTISLNDGLFANLRDKMKVLYWGDQW